MQKAYKNAEFLNSEEARSIRILAEYLEPLKRFKDAGQQRAVVYFGSARTDSEDRYFTEAARLGELMAEWTMKAHSAKERYLICSGGGPGIMEAVHEGGARVNRDLNLGFNISLPFEQHANPHLSEKLAFEFHYFFMRKFWFMNVAHAVVVFPGGFGTCDELFETMTLVQTGKAPKMPIILYGSEFWNKTFNFQEFADRGLISPEDMNLIKFADRPEEARDFLIDHLPLVDPRPSGKGLNFM